MGVNRSQETLCACLGVGSRDGIEKKDENSTDYLQYFMLIIGRGNTCSIISSSVSSVHWLW